MISDTPPSASAPSKPNTLKGNDLLFKHDEPIAPIIFKGDIEVMNIDALCTILRAGSYIAGTGYLLQWNGVVVVDNEKFKLTCPADPAGTPVLVIKAPPPEKKP